MNDKIKAEILETLKVEGLDVAEELAYITVKSAFALINLLAPKVSTIGGSILTYALSVVEPEIFKLIDAIDGEDDPGY